MSARRDLGAGEPITVVDVYAGERARREQTRRDAVLEHLSGGDEDVVEQFAELAAKAMKGER